MARMLNIYKLGSVNIKVFNISVRVGVILLDGYFVFVAAQVAILVEHHMNSGRTE